MKEHSLFTQQERRALNQTDLMRATAEETEKPEDKRTLQNGADALERIMFKPGNKQRMEEN